MEFTKDELLNLVNFEVVEVTFTKVSDGTVRVMRCTMLPEHLPPLEPKPILLQEDDTDTPYVDPQPDLMKVYDLDAQGWRSFRVSTVTEAKILNV